MSNTSNSSVMRPGDKVISADGRSTGVLVSRQLRHANGALARALEVIRNTCTPSRVPTPFAR
jgi:hypothetical protein